MTRLLWNFFGHEDFSVAFLATCVVMCFNILKCAGSKTSCANSVVGWRVTKLVFLICVCSTGVAKGWSASRPLVSSCESAQYLIEEYWSVYSRKFSCFAEEIKKSQLTCQYVFFPPFFFLFVDNVQWRNKNKCIYFEMWCMGILKACHCWNGLNTLLPQSTVVQSRIISLLTIFIFLFLPFCWVSLICDL